MTTNINRSRKVHDMDHRRGQAAIEFLVTYGWAILGVMIVIGVLSYFGIFNTQKYVNDVCYFGDQMTCEDYALYDTSWTYIKLRNNFGVPIDIDGIVLKSDYGTSTCDITDTSPNTNVQPGNIFEVKCALTSTSITTNQKLKYRLTITFKRTGSSNLHDQTGDVLTAVQKWTGTPYIT
jgi:hypothetical protein